MAATWTLAGYGSTGDGATSTLLQNGTVLVAGGVDYANYSGSAKANIYDPVTGIWTPTGSLLALRYGHTATRLSNGNVLVVGGTDYQFMGYPVLDAELRIL